MSQNRHFEHLFVFGRPAAGKSEFVDYVKKCDSQKRLEKFHIASFDILDDFLFIKDISEYETLLEKCSAPRFITKLTKDGIVVTNSVYFSFASEKLNKIILEKYLPHPEFYETKTLLIEFSRGIKNWGYTHSLSLLSGEILKKGAIIYINASYEEALRRNEARYQEKLKYSIMAHKVPEEAMEKYYKTDDWEELTRSEPAGFIKINGIDIPFVTMENEPEEKDPPRLEKRYTDALDIVFELWKAKNVKV